MELFLDQTQVEKRGEWTKEYLLEEHKERSPEQNLLILIQPIDERSEEGRHPPLLSHHFPLV